MIGTFVEATVVGVIRNVGVVCSSVVAGVGTLVVTRISFSVVSIAVMTNSVAYVCCSCDVIIGIIFELPDDTCVTVKGWYTIVSFPVVNSSTLEVEPVEICDEATIGGVV